MGQERVTDKIAEQARVDTPEVVTFSKYDRRSLTYANS